MAENTSIEWCDHTFNPWIGCTKVSPGCLHCYAETRSKRTDGVVWGKGQQRKRTGEGNWKLPLKWNRAAMGESLKHEIEFDKKLRAGTAQAYSPLQRPRVFCASLADWLDDEVPIEWLADLLTLIHDTPNLDWLLLTKRPQNWQPRISELSNCFDLRKEKDVAVWAWIADWYLKGKPPQNIWLGTTVEDQARADERIPLLLSIPAKVRFLSCEPLLGPVNLDRFTEEGSLSSGATHWLTGHTTGDGVYEPWNDNKHRIHWVICGGESGHGARPMHPEWARSLCDQCKIAGVPFLFKQWGEWLPRTYGVMDNSDLNNPRQTTIRLSIDGKNSQTEACDSSYDVWMGKIGKARAGRLLNQVEHNGFPAGGVQ